MAKTQTSPATALTLQRTFPAPRERVFRAWSDPKELALWFSPTPDHKPVVAEMDFRIGGKYRLEVHHKGGNIHRLHGTYKEIVPPEKIAFTWSWGEAPDANISVVTVEFRDLGNSTEITLTHEGLPSVEERDKHFQGWSGVLEQFGIYV
jgi:uncharacterized protein YndB with AHSA1/START domain